MSHFEWVDVDINAGNTVIGIISNIDYDNLTADVEGIGTEIPIHYHCDEDAIEDSGNSFDVDYPDGQDQEGASAFAENDEVVVMYRRINDEDPVIVGFADEAVECLGEYVFVELSLASKISRCIIWNIRRDGLATDVPLNHLEEEDEVFATFPCNSDDISDWLAKHINVGEDLYSEWAYGDQDGETEEWLETCTPPDDCGGGWTDVGSCFGSDSRNSEVPDKDGNVIQDSYTSSIDRTCHVLPGGFGVSGIDAEYTMIQAYKKIIPPFGDNYGLFGSWKLKIENFDENKYTSIREQRIRDYSFNYYYTDDTFGSYGTVTQDKKYVWETPLGKLGEVNYALYERSEFDTDEAPGEEYGYTSEQRTISSENSRIKGAEFSDRSIVQIYFHELFRESRYKNCALLAGTSNYYVYNGDWESGIYGTKCLTDPIWNQTAYERLTFVQAQAVDVFSQGGTRNFDPVSLERSSNLEENISDLVRDFYDFNGAAADDIWDFDTEVSIRDKDETII